MIQILHRYTQAVLYSGEHSTIAEAVTAALKARADLTRSNLSGADLYGADLYGADFYGADFYGANLAGANLTRVNFTGANLSGADLSGADLTRANLTGAKGVEYAQASFPGHGECGRMLTLTRINEELRFFCGCFQGTPEELKTYIKNDEERYRASRTFAMNFCLEAINFTRA